MMVKTKKEIKDKSEIEKLPENIRKIILWLIVTILMVIIFSFWLTSLKATLIPLKKEGGKDKELERIQQNLSDFLNQTKESFTQIGNQIEKLTETTTPAQIDEETIQELKKKLMNEKSEEIEGQ